MDGAEVWLLGKGYQGSELEKGIRVLWKGGRETASDDGVCGAIYFELIFPDWQSLVHCSENKGKTPKSF
jgi:hypothetical protein